MLNILILSNNLSFIIKIVNTLSIKNKKYRIYNISRSIKEVSKIIQVYKDNVNLIITDISNEKISILIEQELLNIPIIIINEKYTNKEIKKNKIFIFNSAKEFFYNLDDTVIEIIKFSKSNIKVLYRIYKYLLKFGYCFSHLGTKYLAHTIYLIFYQNHNIFKLEREIYPIIAKKYNTSIHNIKCDITLATRYMNSIMNAEKDKIIEKILY